MSLRARSFQTGLILSSVFYIASFGWSTVAVAAHDVPPACLEIILSLKKWK